MPHVSPLYGDISAADGYVRAVVTPNGNGVYAPYTTRNGGVLRRKVMVEFPVRTGTIAVYIETVHTPHASAPMPLPPRR